MSADMSPRLTHYTEAQERINIFISHAETLVDGLSRQKGTPYDVGLEQIRQGLLLTLKSVDLGKKEIKQLKGDIKVAEKQIAKQIAFAQREARKTLAAGGDAKLERCIEKMTQPGIQGKVFRLYARVFEKDNYVKAQAALQKAEEALSGSAKKSQPSTQVEKERLAELTASKRQGVAKVGGDIHVQPKFTEKEVLKQLKALEGQVLSDQERPIIEREMQIGEKTFKNQLVPLNRKFDQLLGLGKEFFGHLFGEAGISSANRQEQHIINGFRSELQDGEGKTVLRFFRHGILSSKLITEKQQRASESKQAAKELVTAALMQTLADAGISLEDAQKGMPIQLNLSSLSLVTPDHMRFLLQKNKSERSMLADQAAALRAMRKLTQIEIGGVKIPVKVHVHTFNFGVNDGAMGRIKFAPGIKMGLSTQHKLNKVAWQELKEAYSMMVNPFFIDRASPETQQMEALVKDIDTLMKDERAYQRGGNQYEIGAKILILTNLMHNFAKAKGVKGNYSAALNCMSGKDRTGVMDCVAKAFTAMFLKNGTFPSHEALKKDEGVRKEFGVFLKQFLLESGCLEVTKLNTGAIGYKITETANIADFPLEEFMQLQGFSKTAGA